MQRIFNNTIHYLSQTETSASAYLQKLKEELFVEINGRFEISISRLKILNPLSTYLFGLFNAYGFKELENLEALLDGLSGKQLVSSTHVLVKNRDVLLLSLIDKKEKDEQGFLINENLVEINHPLTLKFSVVPERYNNSANEIFVQKNKLKYPLVIRKWEKGDYFYPLGLNHKKKLSKFFKDEKVDVLTKEEIWLLCSNEQIVWVIGMRADHRFRVENSTEEILKIEMI